MKMMMMMYQQSRHHTAHLISSLSWTTLPPLLRPRILLSQQQQQVLLLLLVVMIGLVINNPNQYHHVQAFTTIHHHHHHSSILIRQRSHNSPYNRIPIRPQHINQKCCLSLFSSINESNEHHHNYSLNEELDRILTTSYTDAMTTPSSSSTTSSSSGGNGSPLRQAITFLQEHSHTIQLNKSNWDNIFTAIEDLTATLAIDNNMNTSTSSTTATEKVEFPLQSTIRQDMTDMYQLLATLPLMSNKDDALTSSTTTSTTITNNNRKGNDEPTLRLFGAVTTNDPPASYLSLIPNSSHNNHNNNDHFIISPQLFEQILNVPMSALTPSSSNTVLYVGVATAILEGIFSLYTGINYNIIVLCTLLFVLLDRIVFNGISIESIVKVINPELQQRIYHHEAGHLLCAYLLGCPIESVVVSAYAALQDPRFRHRPSFTAGTSFFDPILSEQMNASLQSSTKATTTTTISPSSKSSTEIAAIKPTPTTTGVTRSSIDRYSIIVMAGIAAEADQYGQADGGASDEYALIAFLSQLRSNQKSRMGIWNPELIRNQARYGAVQAMLLLRQYRPAYEALVQALQNGGTLKDCIYAIEQAGRKHQLPTRNDRQPVGYVVNNNIIDNSSNEVTSAWIPNTQNNTFIHNFLVRK